MLRFDDRRSRAGGACGPVVRPVRLDRMDGGRRTHGQTFQWGRERARARRDTEQSEAPRGPEAAQTKQSFDEKLRAGTGMCAVGGDGIILKDGLWLHVEESEIATCTCT